MTQLFKRPSFKRDRQLLVDHLKLANRDIPYGQIPTELYEDPLVPDAAKVIFGYLHTFCEPKRLFKCPTCQVPIETISKGVKKAELTVRRNLKLLDRQGWIVITRVGRTMPNKYILFPKDKKAVRKLKKDLKAIDNIKRELLMCKSERYERIRKQVVASQSHRQYEELNIPEVEVLEDITNRTFYKLSPEERDEMKKNWLKKAKNLHAGFLDKKRKNEINMKKIWA